MITIKLGSPHSQGKRGLCWQFVWQRGSIGALSCQGSKGLCQEPLWYCQGCKQNIQQNDIQNGLEQVPLEWPEVLRHTLAHLSIVYRLTGLPETCMQAGLQGVMWLVTLSLLCLLALLR